jgi:geranylgeranylglycerol-phosphate geranylgeranyltransferase
VSGLSTLGHLIIVTRPHNCLIAAAGVAVGAFLAGGSLRPSSIIGSLVAFLVCAGAYALNDLFDVESDRIIKPWRPLASGYLGRKHLLIAVIALWAAGGLLAVAGRGAVGGFFLGWVLLLWLYSWRIKASGLYGHLLVSVTASSAFLLGALTGGDIRAGVIPFVIASPLHLARELVKSVVDVDGDRRARVATFAVRVGEQKAIALSMWCIGGVMVLSLMPFLLSIYGYLYVLPVAIVILPLLAVSMGMLGSSRTGAGRAQVASRGTARMLKITMPVGLAAFLMAGV